MATTEAVNVKTLYSRAMALMGKGRDEEALASFAQIVDRNANIPEVHFQIARIFLRNDQLAKSLTHIRAAAKLKPDVPDIWKVYSEIVRTISHTDEQARFRAALKGAPLDKSTKSTLSTSVDFTGKSVAPLGGTPAPVFERMVAVLAEDRAAEAETLARAELRRTPKSAATRTILAAALLTQERIAEAEEAVREALRIDGNYAEAHCTLARILRAQKRFKEGFKACNHALRLAPGMAAALRMRGEFYRELRWPEEARADLEMLITLEPRNPDHHYVLASLLYENKKFPDVVKVTRKALKSGLKGFGLHSTLAQALGDLGQHEEALEVLEAAKKLYPEAHIAALRIAELNQTLGRFDVAEAGFQEAIRSDPRQGEFYRVYLTAKKLEPGNPMVETMQVHFDDTTIPGKSRAHFGFALAKVMEDQKRHGEVFPYLDRANGLMREAFPYDIDARVAHVEKLLASCRSYDWNDVKFTSTNRFAPIFVTGMPRSGTTLVEQIISSHSKVTGAGELGVASQSALYKIGRESETYRNLTDIEPEALQEIGDEYEAYIRTLHPGVDQITDKSIQTYGYIGALKLAMPQARFVVVRRDPRDNLLSIYKNVFPEGTHGYAYNVEDLAEYYRQFVRTVDYWREVVPDWFYEVQYEDLVANPAEEVPKLIAACGLDWEDACLEFHKNERRVKTLSVYQVRQPMYKSSTRAWERYGEDIRPLLDALGPEYSDAAE